MIILFYELSSFTFIDDDGFMNEFDDEMPKLV